MRSFTPVFGCAILFATWAHLADAQTIAPPCGEQLSADAIYRGVPAKSNDGDQGHLGDCQPFTPPLPPCGVSAADVGCSYGEHYQCVEFMRRFYSLRDDAAQQVDTRGWRRLNAVDYYNSPPAGFVAMPNGGPIPPAPDDILVFDEGGYGHVAIVRDVTSTSVDLIEENWSKIGVISIPMTSTGGSFTVSSRQGRVEVYKAKGWVRRQANSVTFLSFTEGNPGLPGDGVFVSTAGGLFPGKFDLSPQFQLGAATAGLTVTVFPPSNIQNLQSVQINIDTPGCPTQTLRGAALLSIPDGTVAFHGITGFFFNFPQSQLELAASLINQLCPGTTLNDLHITSLFVVNTSNQSITTLDAVSIGLGQNAFPGTQIQ
jgi:hypothetical protein